MEKNSRDQILRQALALTPKIKATDDAVARVMIDRADLQRAFWVTLAADCSMFALGEPGVAKTDTIEVIGGCLSGVNQYTALLPGIGSPQALFVSGISIRESTLPDGSKDITTMETPGRAATANVVVLDETWKVKSPEVLNSLLDLTRSGGIRHEGERLEDHARVIVGISNETPEPGGDFDALWARYILRVPVRHLEIGGRKRMVRAQIEQGRNGAPKITPVDPLTLQDLDTLQRARPWVELPDSIMDTVQEVIVGLHDQSHEEFGWLVTDDRRFGYMMRCLMAHALINGRAAVSSADLTILRWMMWNHKDHIPTVEAVINPLCRTPLGECRELVDTLLATGGIVDQVCQGQAQQVVNALGQVNICRNQLAQKASGLQGVEADKVAAWIRALTSLGGVISQGVSGNIDNCTARAAYDAVKAVLN